MKKAILLLISLISVTTSSIAGSGSAVVPFWSTFSSTQRTIIQISNISNSEINLVFKAFGRDGTETSNLSYENFTDNNTRLAPGTTGRIMIGGTQSNWGYGTIEWSNYPGSNDTVALVASGFSRTAESSLRSEHLIQINNGLPF